LLKATWNTRRMVEKFPAIKPIRAGGFCIDPEEQGCGNQAPLLRKYLLPGKVFATRVPHEISTVLGSCVAVCLWDPFLRAGGMNHFMLPAYNGQDGSGSRYGDIATLSLVERMESLGSRRNNMKAKIYGGGNVLTFSSAGEAELIGTKNADMARKVLETQGIEIVGENVGGLQGRKIRLNTYDGSLAIEVINSLRARQMG